MKPEPGRRLIYTSRSLILKDDMYEHARQVTHILRSARGSNSELGVTGMLLFHGGCFGQVLEGRVKSLLRAMSKIKRDKRHTDINIVREEPLGRRLFGDWSMGLIIGDSAETFRVKLSDDPDTTDSSPIISPEQIDMIAEVRRLVAAA
jgi:blue light- and temperature-responsive anti-repressor